LVFVHTNVSNADHWAVRKYRYTDYKAKYPVRYYFSKNIWITTSGHFSTTALQNAISEIGVDRIMFSIDHPYEDIEEGSDWWDGAPINPNDKVRMGRNTAIDVLKLKLPKMGSEAVFDGLNRNAM
jgi:predicted TIM-barrel fold metal-dependent hydrolase